MWTEIWALGFPARRLTWADLCLNKEGRRRPGGEQQAQSSVSEGRFTLQVGAASPLDPPGCLGPGVSGLSGRGWGCCACSLTHFRCFGKLLPQAGTLGELRAPFSEGTAVPSTHPQCEESRFPGRGWRRAAQLSVCQPQSPDVELRGRDVWLPVYRCSCSSSCLPCPSRDLCASSRALLLPVPRCLV